MIKMDPWHPFVIDLSEKRRQRVLPSHRHHHHHHLLQEAHLYPAEVSHLFQRVKPAGETTFHPQPLLPSRVARLQSTHFPKIWCSPCCPWIKVDDPRQIPSGDGVPSIQQLTPRNFTSNYIISMFTLSKGPLPFPRHLQCPWTTLHNHSAFCLNISRS